MKGAEEFKPDPQPETETELLERLKTAISDLPADQEEALEKSLEADLYKDIGQLSRPMQTLMLQRLKRRTGIGLAESKAYVREARREREMTPTEMRDLVLSSWEASDLHVIYIAKWEEWFIYSGGVYRKTLEASMKKRVAAILEAHDLNLYETVLNDVLAKLSRADTIFREDPPETLPLLNVRNGLLNLETLELAPHSPEVVTFAQAPTDFDPGATAPRFSRFMKRFVPNDRHQLVLQEFMGYVLTPYTFMQRALYLKGPGGTGKGTLLHVMQKLLSTGDHGLSGNIGIEDFNDNSPALVNAIGKRLVYVSEIPTRGNLLGFKKAVGEDPVSVNPKYKPTFNIQLEAKVVITANEHIHTGADNSNNSIARRLLILPFDVKIGAEDHNPRIKDELTTPEELAGVLNWALGGLEVLRTNGWRFSSNGDEGLRLEFLENSNPVITFLGERCAAIDGAKIGTTELYSAWRVWCEGEEVNLLSGQTDFYGGQKERWRKRGGTGHKTGSIKSFSEKTEEALRVLGWKAKKSRDKHGAIWEGLGLM